MIGSYSLSWIFFFIFQMLFCLFGVFSQNVFMKTTVWDKKITFHCRVYLFFLSLGYQTMLVTFMTTTFICLQTVGSMFEVTECWPARRPSLTVHNFAEFTVVIFHLLINLDRLMLSIRPDKSRGRAAKLYFFTSLFVAIAISVFCADMLRYQDIRVYIAFSLLAFLNVLNLLIEIKLFHYTRFVYKNTLGRVPLERRFELSTSVSMIRCFLPASVCGLIVRFTGIIFFLFIFIQIDTIDFPPLLFVLNFFWNLDCVLFPWFFILFHPDRKEKLKRLLRIASVSTSQSQYQTRPALEMQQEHFDQFKVLWRLET